MMTKQLRLSKEEAMALMLMLDNEIQTTFVADTFISPKLDPIADWEFADLYAYKLLAYQKYKRWYKDTHDE